jgi:hypothetical protein
MVRRVLRKVAEFFHTRGSVEKKTLSLPITLAYIDGGLKISPGKNTAG